VQQNASATHPGFVAVKAGGWLAIGLIGAYVLFEVTHLQRFAYRMEPDYILDELVRADRAVTLCGSPPDAERQKFLHNLSIVRERAQSALLSSDPSLSPESGRAQVALKIEAAASTVDDVVAGEGCTSAKVWRWIKLHEVRARLNIQAAASSD
ncbi:MAG: hypothetical protein AAF648_02770, partial [Pseudomonadota bacterium]